MVEILSDVFANVVRGVVAEHLEDEADCEVDLAHWTPEVVNNHVQKHSVRLKKVLQAFHLLARALNVETNRDSPASVVTVVFFVEAGCHVF